MTAVAVKLKNPVSDKEISMNGNGKQTQTPTSQRIQIARERLIQVYNKLNELIIGHEEINKLILVTLIANENAVLISPPGCAKTYTFEILSKLLNARFYKYLLTRFTTDIELFGVYDIKLLVEQGKLVRKWSKIIEADIIFLDEIFKANSAILNSLLSLLQERILYDPYTGQSLKVKALSIFGASNEVPTEEELQALYDRFVVRIFFKYLESDDLILRALEARWLNNSEIEPLANIEDVKVLHEFAMTIIRSEIKGLDKFIKVYHTSAIPFIKSLRSKGIVVSDRTIIEKLPKLIASACALFGIKYDIIINSVIDFLPYLARDQSEFEQIRKTIYEDLGEIAQLHEKLEKARIAIKSGNLELAEKLLNDVINFDMNRIAQKPWLKNRVSAILTEAQRMLQKVQELRATLQKLAESSNSE